MAASVSSGKPEPALQAALEHHLQSQEESGKRIIVRIVKCSLRLSDRTNLYAGYKLLEDQLRYSGLIPNDDPDTIDIQITQIRVSKRKETGTYIQIIYPAD
jgi:hypothetical protein